MSKSRSELFKELMKNFLNVNQQIEAVIVSDEEGFIIAGEKRIDFDIELVSFLTAIVNPILERMRNEFAFKKFGTASFDTDEHRLIFISISETTTLSLVLESMAIVDKISPYAYILAEKTAQILSSTGNELIELTFPDFEYQADLTEDDQRIKNLIYQSKLDSGGKYVFKFIIIGDHEVGKTSIVRRFVEDKFSVNYRATIGLNILTHNFEAFENEISLILWDIGAQEFFKRYRKTYYDGAQAGFIVFDLTNPQSFESVKKWYNELMEFIENKDLPIVIIGNKVDLTDNRAINYEDGVKLAKDLSLISEFATSSGLSDFSDLSDTSCKDEIECGKISYIETSALSGKNIQDAFKLLSHHFIIKSNELEEKRLQNEILTEINLILDDTDLLTLTFITEDAYWNPALQILTEIEGLNKCSEIKEKKKEKIFKYAKGLVLKSYVYGTQKVADSDGVLCVFDARNLGHIIPEWKDNLVKIVEKMKKNKALLIGIRVKEGTDWSQLIEEFEIDQYVENKMISLLFFKIGTDYRVEMYDQIRIMLKTIRDTLFNY